MAAHDEIMAPLGRHQWHHLLSSIRQ
jgi:hypothetical protein